MMVRFIALRLVRAVLVLFSVSALCFLAFELAPGDFFLEARLSPNVSAEAVQSMREQYGLDRSLSVKYAFWLGSVFRGEWGDSLTYGTPVWPILKVRARNTLVLSVIATACAWIAGIGFCLFGIVSGGRILTMLRWFVSILASVPDILICLCVLLLVVWTGWLPVGGMTSFAQSTPSGAYGDLSFHLIAPVMALALAALPQILAHGIAAMSEAVESPAVHAARTHGIGGRRLMYSYVLRAAANPLLSLFGLSIGTLLSASLIVESMMAWPGIGRLLLEATLQRDIYVVLGAMMLSSAFLLAGNFIADLLVYCADPRIRHV